MAHFHNFIATDTSDAEAMIPWEEAFKKYSDQKLSKTMSLGQWLNMWGRLTYGSAGIADFPIWVQILPEIFFKVMDRDNKGVLSAVELKNFYRDMIGITDKATLEKVTKEGYRAMTAVSLVFTKLFDCYYKNKYQLMFHVI